MSQEILNKLSRVMTMEAQALLNHAEKLDDSYVKAVELLKECQGKVIISGVGKSGHIGKKIAASLASTGTPAFFVHSTEGVHGDLGMIEAKDVVILISNSGETAEVLNVIPTLKKIGNKIISITKNPHSTLAKQSDYSLNYSYESEADDLNLAPTTSALITLAIGDALAATVSSLKQFTPEDFHLYHPGGSLGKQLENSGDE